MIVTVLIGIAILAAALFIIAIVYGNVRKLPPSRKAVVKGDAFPEGFLWATGEDAYQHEGGNCNNDWFQWESGTPSPIENGDTCGASVDFFNRYEEDFSRAKSDGQNAHRIGIEWSRVEPERGRYDEKAWDHYGAMLASLKEKGFTVFLNLWHFTLPLWAADLGGWESGAVMERWRAYVRECALRFGRYVDFWSTMIDAQIYALAGYGLGEIPPNRADIALAVKIYGILIHAHAEAYHIIKEHAETPPGGNAAGPRVGMIYFFFHYRAKSFFLDRVVAGQTDRIFNWNFLDAIHSGVIDIGILLGPSLREKDDRLKGTLDWLGVNYYTREILSFNPFKPGMVNRTSYPHYPVTDMGWEIYPEGLYHVCREAARRYPGVPMMITECGLADAKDDRRPGYILDHLAWTLRLIEEGCPVIGFTYWSLTDNWEWAKGFGPKFGLYRVDMKSFAREETRSARIYRFIADNNRLPDNEELRAL
ncbi:MAG: glycoside hydrolase family 1 protein [Spirochaetes bacterium]|nr:glycoside hydrolase family 1 protein [Spirochaetota bacterium]